MVSNVEKSSKTLPKPFTSNEICRIIRLCRKNDVANLKIGELSVSFHEKSPKTVKKVIGSQSHVDLPNVSPVPLSTSKPVVGAERELSEHDKRVIEDLEAAQLLIDDPQAFEAQEIDAAINGTDMVAMNEDERHWGS